MDTNDGGWAAIYLTGAPATGKSTLAKHLTEHNSAFAAFIYGEELTRRVREREEAAGRQAIDQTELRSKSSQVVTPQDVAETDLELQDFLENRSRHVIVDSHAVTKERYGYRVTPFGAPMLPSLRFTHVVCLHTDSTEAIRRISADSQGRPMLTGFQADFHTFLQASVAINYAILLGLPLYVLDSTQPTAVLAEFISKLVSKR